MILKEENNNLIEFKYAHDIKHFQNLFGNQPFENQPAKGASRQYCTYLCWDFPQGQSRF